jgi:hypothetical protein
MSFVGMVSTSIRVETAGNNSIFGQRFLLGRGTGNQCEHR